MKKAITSVLFAFSLVVMLCSVVLHYADSKLPDYEVMQKQMERKICENYANILNNHQESDSDKNKEYLDHLPIDFQIVNTTRTEADLVYAVADQNTLSASANLVDSSDCYIFTRDSSADYNYNLSSLDRAIAYSDKYSDNVCEESTDYESAYTMLYCTSDGLFLLDNEKGSYVKPNKVVVYTSDNVYEFIVNEYGYFYDNATNTSPYETQRDDWLYIEVYDSENLCTIWKAGLNAPKEGIDYEGTLSFETAVNTGFVTSSQFSFTDRDTIIVKNVEKASNVIKYSWIYLLPQNNIAENYPDSLFGKAKAWLDIIYFLSSKAIFVEIISLILVLVLGIYLVRIAGQKKGETEIYLTWYDRMPWLLQILLVAAVELVMLFGELGIVDQLRAEGPVMAYLLLLFEAAFIMALVFTVFLLSFVTRIKSKKFGKYTLWATVCRNIGDNVKLVGKLLLLILFVLLVQFGLWLLFELINKPMLFPIVLVIINAIILAMMIRQATQWKRIKDATEEICAGNLENRIDTENMMSEFREHADNINNIVNGFNIAVNEKIKSERFRTELITNVSHDIKTPLTSIISYVDLMKKEDIEDPTIKEYTEVLDRQSARLKKLIEDLMEASKASTGNLKVNLEEFDVAVMLTQTAGEFEEKLSSKGLELIIEKPDHPIVISADGRHLWRVFDNLLNNVYKYAQTGTRVFINITEEDGHVNIIFKNTSAAMLNITTEELMERFVRGDSSRNTEGSGLGLSIVKSLLELMNGSIRLEIDGDLFKAIITF